jgi:hypothetical protein
MINIVHPDTLEEISFRSDLQKHFPLKARQIRLTREKATIQGSFQEWLGGIILIVIAKPFTDSFLKALGKEAGEGLAATIKTWFKKAKSGGYQKVTANSFDRRGRLIGKPRWVRSIVQLDICLRLGDGSNKEVSFVLPRNLRHKDLDAALLAIARNDFAADSKDLFFVYSRRSQKWVAVDNLASSRTGRTKKIGNVTVTLIKDEPDYP